MNYKEEASIIKQSPILLLGFNRPDKIRQVLHEIRKYKPGTFYVAIDGPRENHRDDKQLVRQVKGEIDACVDWPCRVETRYRDRNMGCRKAVLDALEWAFANEEKLVVLEDDCVPTADFFTFAEELLEKYSDNEQIGSISGSNLRKMPAPDGCSYYWSRYFHCWGWASWRRCWYARQREKLIQTNNFSFLHDLGLPAKEITFWKSIAMRIESKEIDSWAYEFSLLSLQQGWLNAIPSISLIRNIGFDLEATRTKQAQSFDLSYGALEFPLRHPQLTTWLKADLAVSARIFQTPALASRLLRRIKSVLRRPILKQ